MFPRPQERISTLISLVDAHHGYRHFAPIGSQTQRCLGDRCEIADKIPMSEIGIAVSKDLERQS